jgi:hypothetical protein
MPHEYDAGELSEGLNDVEVAQGADFKKGHAVLFCVGTGLLCWDLTLEGQVQPVPNQDPGDPRCMLGEEGTELSRGTTIEVPPTLTSRQGPHCLHSGVGWAQGGLGRPGCMAKPSCSHAEPHSWAVYPDMDQTSWALHRP